MLIDGRSAMTEVPPDRFNIDSFYHPNGDRLDTVDYDHLNVRAGHFLRDDLAAFDAPFFSIPYHEAISLDPQQRGLLEDTYKALENGMFALNLKPGSADINLAIQQVSAWKRAMALKRALLLDALQKSTRPYSPEIRKFNQSIKHLVLGRQCSPIVSAGSTTSGGLVSRWTRLAPAA
ncbi:MAG: hypothetical protein Q9190_000364 [Brigantiaea leucoxantha]